MSQDALGLELVDECAEQLAILAELPKLLDRRQHLGQRRSRHSRRLRAWHRIEWASGQPVPRRPLRQPEHLGRDRHPHAWHLLLAALTHQRQPALELRAHRRVVRRQVEVDQILHCSLGGADVGDQAHVARVRIGLREPAVPGGRVAVFCERRGVANCRAGDEIASTKPFRRMSVPGRSGGVATTPQVSRHRGCPPTVRLPRTRRRFPRSGGPRCTAL